VFHRALPSQITPCQLATPRLGRARYERFNAQIGGPLRWQPETCFLDRAADSADDRNRQSANKIGLQNLVYNIRRLVHSNGWPSQSGVRPGRLGAERQADTAKLRYRQITSEIDPHGLTIRAKTSLFEAPQNARQGHPEADFHLGRSFTFTNHEG
jgi:hypothetical protein